MVYYIVTITKPQRLTKIHYEELDDVINILETYFIDIIHWQSEFHGMYNQLHAHALVRANKYFRYSKHTKLNGFQIHYRKVMNESEANLHNIILYIDKYRHYGCAAINHYSSYYFNQDSQEYQSLAPLL